jgi:UDP:flavonoid glycosyltransferase YjiC (YdhE family)
LLTVASAVSSRDVSLRLLFSCLPAYGHLQPMVPLARACLSAGHDVLVATGPDMQRRANALGLALAPVGPTRSEGDQLVRRGPADESDQPTRMRRIWDNYTFVHRIPADGARLRAAELVPLVADWKPDVVVHDVTDFAAPLAAALSGSPSALHGWGVPVPGKLMARAAVKAAPLWVEHGLDPRPAAGMFAGLYLSLCPPSLWPDDAGDVGRVQSLRPEPVAEHDRHLPRLLERLPYDRTVHVTLGTVANRSVDTFRVILAGLADLAANVVVTVGPDTSPDVLGPQPDHILVASYLPIDEVLRFSHAVVAHGGSGTMLAALRAGLPQLFVPYDADNVRNARLCEAAGAAVSISLPDVTAEGVREKTRRILDDSSLASGAKRLRDEIVAMPRPDEVVSVLERLTNRDQKE